MKNEHFQIISERMKYHKQTEGVYLKNIATSYEDDDIAFVQGV